MQALRGREAGRRHAGHHLLMLPEGVRDSAVAELVFAHHPDAATHAGEGLRLGRHASLVGPLALDAGSAAAAGVPAPWRTVWALECAPDREGPPMPGPGDRDGLTRAFEDGLPVRAERRAVDLLLGLARRLGGAVRIAPRGAVLRPDPYAWIDVIVYSRFWLDPDQAHEVVRSAAPSARLAMGGAVWAGLRPAALRTLVATETPLSLAQRDQLHHRADDWDRSATQGPDVLDGYAIAAPLGGADAEDDPDAGGAVGIGAAGVGAHGVRADGIRADGVDDGMLEVVVNGVDDPPPVLRTGPAASWATPPVSYRVRWWPPDEAAAEHERPSASYLAVRGRAAVVLSAVVAALVDAVEGVAVDAGGFPVSTAV